MAPHKQSGSKERLRPLFSFTGRTHAMKKGFYTIAAALFVSPNASDVLLPAAGTPARWIIALCDTPLAAMTGDAIHGADANALAILAVRPGIHAHGAG